MTIIWMITALLLLGIGSATASLRAEEIAVNQYFPLALGNRWIYELHDRTDAPPALESWEVVREERGTFVLRIGQSKLTTGGLEEFFIPTSTGIKRFARETQNKADPPFFLKGPIRVGVTWEDEDGTYEITALNKTVTVPAGTFQHCVEVTNHRRGGKATVVTLYAPRVGVVQREEVFPIIEGSGSFYPQRQDKALLELREWELRATNATPCSPAEADAGRAGTVSH